MNELDFYCSYLKEEIDPGLCYDIQMIRYKSIKPSALPDIELEYEVLDKCCEKCCNKQL